MCGICVVHDPTGIDRTDVERMVHGLRHRGPDDSGLEVNPRAALGHTRLSIIGLETGHQPISNEDDTIWITFNGEGGGAEAPHRFKTDSDTEVILHLYEEMGDACVKRLRGMCRPRDSGAGRRSSSTSRCSHE